VVVWSVASLVLKQCSLGGMDLDSLVEAVIVVLRTKVFLNLVGADNEGARGRRFTS
jgi:hypothetical protein